jgi:hypothetical protein
MSTVDRSLPHPGEVLEEPIRPLLAVVDTAVEALQVALDAESLADGADDDEAATPTHWAAQMLSAQIEALRAALDHYKRALRLRNDPARLSRSHADI